MITERVNYYEYLGIDAEASVDDIKDAIKAQKGSFAADGINAQEITKVMTNEALREAEKEAYIKLLSDDGDGLDVELGSLSLSDYDIEEVTEVVCWNCANKYEYNTFLENNCPVCNAEKSQRVFKMELDQLVDDIKINCPKEQLKFELNVLYQRYGASETYVATSQLDALKGQIDALSSLGKTHEEINSALDRIEQCCSRKQIYTAYSEYTVIKDKLYSEGCFTDGRVVRLLDEYRICNENLERLREAAQRLSYDILFPTVSELKKHTIDCSEAEDIMRGIEIPCVKNLKLIEDDHRVSLSWEHDVDGVSFSVHKSVNGAEPICIQDGILEKCYSYNEPTNGAEITYTVWTHFDGSRSKNDPCRSVAFFDNVRILSEDKVSGAIAYRWVAPLGCSILVCKAENNVPDSWEKAEYVSEVNESGFIDKNVKRGRKYGYKIKCVYETHKGEVESTSLNLHPCAAYFEFVPISIITQNADLDVCRWNVAFQPLGIGKATFFKSERRVEVNENYLYSIDELAAMGIHHCMAEIGEKTASVKLDNGETKYYYAASTNDGQIYIRQPVEINVHSSIYDLKVTNVGDSNKTIEISFLWGEKSKTIAVIDGDGHYYETFETQPNMWYKEKNKKTGERDTLIVRLNERETHYLSVFEIDELGKSRLIYKMEPLTERRQELLYTVKVSATKATVTLFFEDRYSVDKIHLCKKYDDGVIESIYCCSGPLEGKPRLLKGITASFTANVPNLLGVDLVLRFDDGKQDKILNINNRAYLVTLKEKW